MNIVKISLTLFLSITSIVLMAQRRDFDPEARMKAQTERLTKALDLSDAQVSKVTEVNTGLMEMMKAARDDAQGNREAMRGMRQQANKARDAKYKEIFTEEQWTKYEAFKAENRENRQRPDGDRPRPPKGKKKKKDKDIDDSGL